MVGFENIAIFLLATTLRNSYENRIKPIMATWGKEFEHLYFVMGANAADKPFLDTTCALANKSTTAADSDQRRQLKAKRGKPVTPGELWQYVCPVPDRHANVLYASNCSGTYFGHGPTCRCEESMRAFLYSPRLAHTQWFMFLDDDVYVRPVPLMSFLGEFNSIIDQSITVLRLGSVST